MKRINVLRQSKFDKMSENEMTKVKGGIGWFFPFIGGAILGDILFSPKQCQDAFIKAAQDELSQINN